MSLGKTNLFSMHFQKKMIFFKNKVLSPFQRLFSKTKPLFFFFLIPFFKTFSFLWKWSFKFFANFIFSKNVSFPSFKKNPKIILKKKKSSFLQQKCFLFILKKIYDESNHLNEQSFKKGISLFLKVMGFLEPKFYLIKIKSINLFKTLLPKIKLPYKNVFNVSFLLP